MQTNRSSPHKRWPRCRRSTSRRCCSPGLRPSPRCSTSSTGSSVSCSARVLSKRRERFAPEPDPQQMHLGQMPGEIPAAPEQPEAGSPGAGAHAPQDPQRLRRRRSERPVLRRGRGAGADHRGAQPRGAGSCARAVRGHRPEGQPPAGAAPGQLRRPEIRAARHQSSRHADSALCAGGGGRHRGQSCRRELASSDCWSTSSATTCRCIASTRVLFNGSQGAA